MQAIKKMLLTKAIHKVERQMDDRDVDYKWRDKDSYPTFQDFVDFIERHAHIYNDPLYGGDALQEPGRKQCIVCNNDHKLCLCKKFRKCSVTDRIKIVYV